MNYVREHEVVLGAHVSMKKYVNLRELTVFLFLH